MPQSPPRSEPRWVFLALAALGLTLVYGGAWLLLADPERSTAHVGPVVAILFGVALGAWGVWAFTRRG